MSNIIGIDLGTTNACVAVMRDGQLQVIPSAEGHRTTPSVVAWTDNDEQLVGDIARRQAVTNAERTVTSIKRFMGQPSTSPVAQRFAETVGYPVLPLGEGWQIDIGPKPITPEIVSAAILTQLREAAQDYLEAEVRDAVITVPAYFNDLQRQATKNAGQMAGLQVRRIINEPTAASLAYGAQRRRQRVAVYDLGGGTFDVSIVDIDDGVLEVRATAGDPHLGGDDIDDAIVEHILEHIQVAHPTADLRTDLHALQRVREAANKLKHELSSLTESDITLPFLSVVNGTPLHFNGLMTRQELEQLVEPLIQRTTAPYRQAMADAGVSAGDIDEVLLVGGQTRMPRILQVVQGLFGKRPNVSLNPDEVVAVGAAAQGAILAGDLKDTLLLDVTPLSLGVETAGGRMAVLIERNTKIPVRKAQVFTTAADNQPIVDVHVAQGERPMIADNASLARFQLTGVPPAPRGVPMIEVAFEIDADGIMHAIATDKATRKRQSMRVVEGLRLTPDEIERAVADAEAHRARDAERRTLAEAVVIALALVHTNERFIEEYGSALSNDQLAEVQEDIEAVKQVCAETPARLDRVRAAVQRLEASSQAIVEAMLRDTQSP